MPIICIPQAVGVPAAPGGPRWWEPEDPAVPVTALNQRINDPRWRGAVALGVPGPVGSGDKATFRALHEVDAAGVTHLLLSWYVKADAGLDRGADKLFVGFKRKDPAGGAGGKAVVFSIDAFPLTGALPISPPFAPLAGAVTTFEQPAAGGAWSTAATPTWLRNPADPATRSRVWATLAPRWAINVSVPLTAGADVDNNGMNLGAEFRFWFELQVQVPGAGMYFGRWPDGVAVSGGDPPAPSSWGDARVGGAGCGTGVSLSPLQIGTRNPIPSQIRFEKDAPFPANQVFAAPSNTGPPLVAGAINARFRIANWGSQPDWNAAANLWPDIPGGAAVPNAVGAGGSPVSEFTWMLDDTDPLKPGFVSGARREHQCMLVELTGGGVTFLNDSTYRNMDVVDASTFERDAEISVKELPPLAGPRRTVYLYVETANMPADIDGRERPRDGKLAAAVLSHGGEGEEPPPTFDELVATTPTYIVHAFHETGERVTVGGRNVPVLEAQTSFGYFVDHSGALFGWDHALTGGGIRRIGRNLYKVSVPNDGSVTVTTSITALERPRPWWKRLLRWLLELLRRLIAWLLGKLGK